MAARAVVNVERRAARPAATSLTRPAPGAATAAGAPPPAAPITAAVVSAPPLVRAGLAAALAAHGGFAPAPAFASLDEARSAGFGGARVAIVDVADDGDEIVAGDAPALLLLAAAGDARIGEWLIDGCSVLPRGASGDAIAAAAEAALAGLVATPPSFAADALRYERTGETQPAVAGRERLTRREKQVLVEMSHGLGNREIGSALGISAHTAKFHVAQIIAKLDAQSRAHAVAKALRAGLVDA